MLCWRIEIRRRTLVHDEADGRPRNSHGTAMEQMEQMEQMERP